MPKKNDVTIKSSIIKIIIGGKKSGWKLKLMEEKWWKGKMF